MEIINEHFIFALSSKTMPYEETNSTPQACWTESAFVAIRCDEIGLFGSTVRGENKPGSDIDVLIDFQVQEMQEKTNYTS